MLYNIILKSHNETAKEFLLNNVVNALTRNDYTVFYFNNGERLEIPKSLLIKYERVETGDIIWDIGDIIPLSNVS